MSKGFHRPSTIEGIKSRAKEIKSAEGLRHFEALNLAARAGGFQNYADAQRSLVSRPAPKPRHLVYLSSLWRDRETGTHGQEVLTVRLSRPLAELVTPLQLGYARYLARSRKVASDHLAAELPADSLSAARRWACGAARTLQFADASGLKPSRATTKGYPGGLFRNAMPGRDHDSVWYDPKAKVHIVVDEPYSSRTAGLSPEREAWAQRHGWEIARPSWPGMYNPDGGCSLFLAVDATKGYSLAPILQALDALPHPPVEAEWNGRSIPAFPVFTSPASEAKRIAEKAPKEPRKRGPATSVTYHSIFGKLRRRPKGSLPVKVHMEIGQLLQDTISATWERNGIRKPLEIVRTTLDDWVQLEYGRKELSDEDFSKMYYGSVVHSSPSKKPPENKGTLKLNLDRAATLLEQGYTACPPLSSILKGIDAARNALLRW